MLAMLEESPAEPVAVVVNERIFEFTGGELPIRIYAPQVYRTVPHSCTFTVAAG